MLLIAEMKSHEYSLQLVFYQVSPSLTLSLPAADKKEAPKGMYNGDFYC